MTSVNDEGWNQVRRKNGRKRNRAEPRQPTGIGPNPSPELSIDDIREYHNGIARDWLASDSWQALLGILMTATSPQRRPLPICKAICLGPGPFDPANGSTAIRRTAHIQTAAFVSIVSALETQLGQKIRCIIQEPGFTDVDKQFCQDDLGFLVVDTPEAFSMVDENTLIKWIIIVLASLFIIVPIAIGTGLADGSTNSTTTSHPTSSPTSSSSTSSSVTSSASPTPTHVASNNTLYYVPGSTKTFLQVCGIDYSGNGEATDLTYVYTGSMADCMNTCATYDKCTGCGWGPLPGDLGPPHRCWLKKDLRGAHEARDDYCFGILQM
ncbi:hypothetical protein QBC47DRAFT_426308 [Echria macrotheca]|uniref:SRR1-like domain-containing protein n=1 Tax=Echria macrotheca TaxID=438768 RepID=A0AAJ0F6N1_9PEZI|nr:hypothetical protein QBC47DRAFT_426308 [Echria macrotheca]